MDFDQLPDQLYTAAGVRALDQVVISRFGVSGLKLMRRAAQSCVRIIRQRFSHVNNIAVMCGGGNNGGDGYIIAGLLAESGAVVRVYHLADPKRLGGDAAEAFRYCCSTPAVLLPFSADTTLDADLVVDAMLGIGVTGTVKGTYGDAIDLVNSSGLPVLSVDVPSGLCADTGMRLGVAVSADVTVTFIGLKQGLFTGDGPDCAGEVCFERLDVTDQAFESVAPSAELLKLPALLENLPRRKRNSHKNHFGHVLVVGGGEGMGGAVAMSAEAALRTGAGLVSVATHPAHVGPLLTRRPELMAKGILEAVDMDALMARATVLVLGPGLGRDEWSRSLFERAMEHVTQSMKPLVIDADGLFFLAAATRRSDNQVLTPHPGEAARLLPSDIQSNRFEAVARLQEKYGGVVVLKGAGTLIHDGSRCSVCGYGNPGMSTAGSGDVLSGVIGGLIAQGLAPSDAARIGVAAHARAGDLCARNAGERGLVATDLIEPVRWLLNGRDNDGGF